MTDLTKNGKALVVTQLFRLLFGGYLIGMDQYRFNDPGSALTVLFIYGLICILTVLYLLGKRIALLFIIILDSIFIALQLVFSVFVRSGIIDPGLHNPVNNWWSILLMFVFSLLTIIFALNAYRER